MTRTMSENDAVLESYINKIDKMGFRDEYKNEMRTLIIMLFILISENVRLSILDDLNNKEAQKVFRTQIDFVKYGVMKI